MNRIQTPKQSGFTLIELIVVMVILGILAATALPKFVDLGSDARIASLNGARGAISSASAMVHGKWLAGGSSASTITVEGVQLDMDTGGYIKVSDATDLMAVSGITSADYTIVAAGTATPSSDEPATAADEVAIVPIGLKGSTKGAKCFIKYKHTTDSTAFPTFTSDTSGC